MDSRKGHVAWVLVFDVNETLLDLAALREPFSRAFGDPAPMGEWFVRLLHGSLVATLTDTYDDFATIARRALDALAKRNGRDLHVEDRDTILETMLELPAHPEVPGALSRLRSAGFPLATLTNSSPEMVRAQLGYPGILDLFDHACRSRRSVATSRHPSLTTWRPSASAPRPRRSGWWPPTTGTFGRRCARDAPRRTWRGRMSRS